MVFFPISLHVCAAVLIIWLSHVLYLCFLSFSVCACSLLCVFSSTTWYRVKRNDTPSRNSKYIYQADALCRLITRDSDHLWSVVLFWMESDCKIEWHSNFVSQVMYDHQYRLYLLLLPSTARLLGKHKLSTFSSANTWQHECVLRSSPLSYFEYLKCFE